MLEYLFFLLIFWKMVLILEWIECQSVWAYKEQLFDD